MFLEAQRSADAAMERTMLIENDAAHLQKLFRRIANELKHVRVRFISAESLVLFTLALETKPSHAEFLAILKEMGCESSARVAFPGFRKWWEELGSEGKGAGAKFLRVEETGADGPGSAAAWVARCIGFIDGTFRPCARPGGGDGRRQRQLYSGYKKLHGIKFQSVVAANGLIVQ